MQELTGYPMAGLDLRDSQSKQCVRPGGSREGGSTVGSAEFPKLTTMACNGLKLLTGRPLSYEIWKTLFQNSLCFIHCFVPIFTPLADARFLQTSCRLYTGYLQGRRKRYGRYGRYGFGRTTLLWPCLQPGCG